MNRTKGWLWTHRAGLYRVHAVLVFMGLAALADWLLLAILHPISGGADSEWATGSAETVKRWAKQAWVELPKLIYWNKFMSKGLNTVIQVKDDLEGQPGDKITFSFVRKLQTSGVSGDADLETNEEAMVTYQDDVTIDQKRQAIRLKGRMSERRTAYSQRSVAKELLTTWLAETIDSDIFAFDKTKFIGH